MQIFGQKTGGKPIYYRDGRHVTLDHYTAVIQSTTLSPTLSILHRLRWRRADWKYKADCLPNISGIGEPADFRVAHGGCAGYTPEYERMWDTIASFRPAAMLLLGDNVYIDLPQEAGPLHRYTMYQLSRVPNFGGWSRPRRFLQYGMTTTLPSTTCGWAPIATSRAGSLRCSRCSRRIGIMQRIGDRDWPGCWFKFSIADVDFFMLDCRYYRTNPFADERTMLGPVQKDWLLNELKNSKAAFKIIASSVAWASGAKPGSRDTWDGFPAQREEIFSWIERNGIDGVVLLSADRHRSDAWKILRPNGYPLYDLLSSASRIPKPVTCRSAFRLQRKVFVWTIDV